MSEPSLVEVSDEILLFIEVSFVFINDANEVSPLALATSSVEILVVNDPWAESIDVTSESLPWIADANSLRVSNVDGAESTIESIADVIAEFLEFTSLDISLSILVSNELSADALTDSSLATLVVSEETPSSLFDILTSIEESSYAESSIPEILISIEFTSDVRLSHHLKL